MGARLVEGGTRWRSASPCLVEDQGASAIAGHLDPRHAVRRRSTGHFVHGFATTLSPALSGVLFVIGRVSRRFSTSIAPRYEFCAQKDQV